MNRLAQKYSRLNDLLRQAALLAGTSWVAHGRRRSMVDHITLDNLEALMALGTDRGAA